MPEPLAVTANHRKLFVAYVIAETVAGKASTVLPASVRDLAVYRVAWTVGCSWCVDFGTMLARLDGLDIDRLKEIGDYATSPHYSDNERAAIAYADAMTATHSEITDEQVADLERRFGRDGVVELTYQIALENLRSRMNSALGITEQGFSSGDACRVPWVDETTEEVRMAKEIDEILEFRFGSEGEPGCGEFRDEDAAHPRRPGGPQ